jgi:glycosyltransferase involved in cell wall biosynthesis
MKQAGYEASLVSNGVNTEQFWFKNKPADKEKKILFIGDFKWIQNIDSVTFIIKQIWPLLRQGYGGQADIKLWIVGREIPSSIKALSSDPDVLFDEESSSKSTPEIFREASVLLAPIRVGGGTSYKILESMSSGTPVVTMQLSADAIEAKDEKSIMVGNSAAELADKTGQLLENAVLYERIRKEARLLIEKKYTWKAIAKELEKAYE